jgi:hypothetical protein
LVEIVLLETKSSGGCNSAIAMKRKVLGRSTFHFTLPFNPAEDSAPCLRREIDARQASVARGGGEISGIMEQVFFDTSRGLHEIDLRSGA